MEEKVNYIWINVKTSFGTLSRLCYNGSCSIEEANQITGALDILAIAKEMNDLNGKIKSIELVYQNLATGSVLYSKSF